MSAPRLAALPRLVRAAERELARLFGPLVARVRRFLAALRGLTLLPGQALRLNRLVFQGLRTLTGAAPGLQFPRSNPGGGTAPLPALLRATIRAAAGLVTPAEADRAVAFAHALDYRAPDGIALSARLWRNGQLIRRRVDETITQAVRAGLTPAEVRERVEGLLIGTAERGAGPANLRRLIATEASRAHGLATIRHATRTGQLVEWVLSPVHADNDVCSGYAEEDNGYGPGVYEAGALPSYPAHPNCLCVLMAVGGGA